MTNGRQVLQIHPDDDVAVALVDQPAGQSVTLSGRRITLTEPVAAKHKFACRPIARGAPLRMYGITVGKAVEDIAQGQRITTGNLSHATDPVAPSDSPRRWQAPDVSSWKDRKFLGYVRDDGRAGTANYWIVAPLVFCENRNVRVLEEALVDELGYGSTQEFRLLTRQLIDQWSDGHTRTASVRNGGFRRVSRVDRRRVFPHVDGVKFLRHDGGCGGTYGDAVALCGLLAGYINHPNVAGATVLSLGCQKAQRQVLEEQIHQRNPRFKKPLLIFEQQQAQSQHGMMQQAITRTFAGLVEANGARREPVELSRLSMGVECGGSDGFSGISANPCIGACSDLLVALGGTVILSEFPELAGCEQDLVDRCASRTLAERFLRIMQSYHQRAMAVGEGFANNPSPGNIRDGLITDAMKSAGAAKKGGTSPVADVLDYPQPAVQRGLNLLCTPGGDVESTTAMVGSGAQIIVFSTGLGTPTGNPIAPVLKVSSNSELARRMPDIIDLDAGPILTEDASIDQMGQRLLQRVIATASGQYQCKAQQLGQDDFIPWKRGISL